jgi:hypothetical protein
MVMFYRWAKRLESVQFPATAFPAAGGDPAIETEESHELDGALVGAAIASLWVLLQTPRSTSFVSLDWAVNTYVPIFLVTVLGALLVRPPAPKRSIAAHVTAYVGVAALMGVARATSPLEVVVWGGFFALLGLVTTVLCVVVWTAALNQLATPRTLLNRYANHFRAVCVALILGAALIGLSKAITIPFIGN